MPLSPMEIGSKWLQAMSISSGYRHRPLNFRHLSNPIQLLMQKSYCAPMSTSRSRRERLRPHRNNHLRRLRLDKSELKHPYSLAALVRQFRPALTMKKPPLKPHTNLNSSKEIET